ncbi:MAG: hypothetical protein EBU66_15630, partial [Bacteroidetes bacterium]|nr:hypothetical protein [Bacteroidota bacterium]
MTGKKGGEFIASGTYGCVFAPPIKCNRKPSKLPKENVVGKVYSDDEEIKEERKSYEIMKKIDPKGKFSLPFYGVCKLNIKNAVLSDKIDKCGHIESFKKDYQQLLSEFGGLELKNAMKTVELYDLIPAFYELFKGLDVMIKAGYCHKDIKGPNILYNLDTKKIVFADYGMLMKIKDLPKTASRDAYMWWPPEMFFLYIRKYMSLRANFPYDYMTACHHLLSGFNWFGVANIENVYPDFVNDLTSYAKLCFTKPYSELLNEYNDNKYGEKFDIYSLCMTFIECYVKYTSI